LNHRDTETQRDPPTQTAHRSHRETQIHPGAHVTTTKTPRHQGADADLDKRLRFLVAERQAIW